MNRLSLIFIFLLVSTNVLSADRTVNLVVSYKNVAFTGKCIQAIAVNNQIPAPTLHFQEGDNVTINVHNQLNEETAIHWHGIIIPWQMDGVAGITQRGIKPGHIFQYKFTIKQSGTYWYHAHAGLQEQQGLYGAFIIDPIQQPSYHYTKDFVIVLSDWSNTHPNQILANLKKEGDYYSPRFPMQPSLIRFLQNYCKANQTERKLIIDDYKMMQQMRMSIYDINDVAYDALLLNGHPKSNPWLGHVKAGDIVRLRFIGAGGNSVFHVKLPNTEFEMIHVQGNDIKPYTLKDFTIAPGETYDILVKIKDNEPQIIYVESTDQVAAVYGALVTSKHPLVNYNQISPFPEPLPVTREMMLYGMGHHGGMNHKANHGSMSHESMEHHGGMNHETNHGSMSHESMGHHSNTNHKANHSSMSHESMGHQSMNHSKMDHKATKENSDTGSQIAKTKYKNLKAAQITNDPDKPIYKTINMELNGWMDRFIWFINGVPEHDANPIVLEPNKRYRIVFKNTSMMHHPMHIHGHWFIVRKELGAYDPLLHTIDMPPGATIIADIDTDASGQWLFHCHFLYHMMSGMARVFQYSSLIEITKGKALAQDIVETTQYNNRPIVKVDALKPIDISLVKHPMAHPKIPYFSNNLEIGADFFNNIQRMTFKGLYGFDYNKIELFMNDAEINKGTTENADLDIFFWHLISEFWAVKGGINYYYRPSLTPYIQPGIGLEGMMPYFIETDFRGYYHKGSFKLDVEFERDLQITNNFFIRAGIRSILATKTVIEDEIGSGLNQMRYILAPFYRLKPGLNIIVEYEYEREHGALKNIRLAENESILQNTVTFGVGLLF
ncbi:MAG: multicopper oxidase domain-containing protein [Proteobacteria bacterium]|nr:multicopper oxidase domain-containing protein [Pseudomonadota bacterium]